MTIRQKIHPRLDQVLHNYALYPCHVQTLSMILSAARKNEWGSPENNDLVNELYIMFSSLSSQIDEQIIVKKLQDGTY